MNCVARFLAPASIFTVFLLSSVTPQTAPPVGNISRGDTQRQRNEAAIEQRMMDMRGLENKLRKVTERDRRTVSEPKLTAEQRDRILRLRKVGAADIQGLANFLEQPTTGVFKLFPDLGCVSKNLIRISEDCARFVPLSSSFDFRTNRYGDEIYHDIRFENGRIYSDSFFSQGILTVVGDMPIDNVSLSDPAIRFLEDFQADIEPRSAMRHAKEFLTGVDSGGFHYADAIEPKDNTTYAMRMIAYRLENTLPPLLPDLSMNELLFHSLAMDKRVDLIVAFRLLRTDENGGVTIVWKELSRKDSSKIKFSKSDPLRDFRPPRRDSK